MEISYRTCSIKKSQPLGQDSLLLIFSVFFALFFQEFCLQGLYAPAARILLFPGLSLDQGKLVYQVQMFLAFQQYRKIILDAVVCKADILEETGLVLAQMPGVSILADGLLEEVILWPFVFLLYREEDNLCYSFAGLQRSECEAYR